MSHRLACLDYPKAIARDLPMGSGLIESRHKHLLQARLKNAACARLPANTDAPAQLRAIQTLPHFNASMRKH